MSIRKSHVAELCLALFVYGPPAHARDGLAPLMLPLKPYNAHAACLFCTGLARAVTADYQQAVEADKLCRQAFAVEEQTKRWGDEQKSDSACNERNTQIIIYNHDIGELEACNAKCAKADPPPPPPPPPPKPPQPEPPKPPAPPPPKPTSGPGKTATHVQTCSACQSWADALNKATERCSSQNDPTNCAAMKMLQNSLAECERKQCVVNKPFGTDPEVPVNKGHNLPPLGGDPERKAGGAALVPGQQPTQQSAKQPSQQSVKQPTPPPKPQQTPQHLPVQQRAPQVVPQRQPAQQSTLKLPPKAPTQEQPALKAPSQQPAQQGALKLPAQQQQKPAVQIPAKPGTQPSSSQQTIQQGGQQVSPKKAIDATQQTPQ